MSIIDKLKKNSQSKLTNTLDKSEFFSKDIIQIPTKIPALNVALSADYKGGLRSGFIQIAGDSKHFKTAFALLLCKTFLDKYDDGAILFYDSEFGATPSYFESFKIDTSRVVHTPVTTVEGLKHDISNQLDGMERKDHVMIMIDSIGNIGSMKEVEDAKKSDAPPADMTRAKAFNSFSRVVGVQLKILDIPMVGINHVYDSIGGYIQTKTTKGGKGLYYISDDLWIITRAQEKDKQGDKDIAGYKFTIGIDKSRTVKEKSKIPIVVKFDGGINPYSGLMEWALEFGSVTKPNAQHYTRMNVVDEETGEVVADKNWKLKQTNCSEFWKPLMNEEFREWIKEKFILADTDMVQEDVIFAEDE
jgi:hypothetical protein